MCRLLLPWVGGIFLSDRLFQGALPVWGVGAVSIVCLAGMALWLRSRKYASRWCYGWLACLFLFCAGALRMQHEWQGVDYEWPSGKALYQGVVVEAPRAKTKTYLCKLRVDSRWSDGKALPVCRQALVYIMKDSLSGMLQCGDRLDFYARITPPEREDISGNFDYAAFLFRRQISGTAVVFSGHWWHAGKEMPLMWKQYADVWREKILDCYRDWGVSGDEFAILSALTVGYKDELGEDLRETYRRVGASHILALSGMHVAILWGLLCFVLCPLRGRRFMRWLRFGLIVLLLWAFAFLVGLPASVIRAVVMCMLMTLARAAGERPLSLNTLAITAFFMLLYDPFYLFDIGFQLSFLAVFSILLVYPFLVRYWEVRHPLLRYFVGIVVVSLAAQLGTAPVVLYCFSYFPLYFLPANLIVAPLLPLILYGAVVAFVLSPFAVLHSGVLVGLNGLLEWLNRGVRWVERWPAPHWGDIHLSLLQVVVLYVWLWMMWIYVSRFSRKGLIGALLALNLFIMVSGWRYVGGEEPSRLIFRRSKVEVYPEKELWQQDGLYCHEGLNICVVSDDRWLDKTSGQLLDVDYMYVCKGFKGKIAALQRIFRIRKVILDTSLGDYRLHLLKKECESLGLDYVDMSPKGSFRILL